MNNDRMPNNLTTDTRKGLAGFTLQHQPQIAWILRLTVGGVFTYSGFVKMIDPWGTFYKLQEYAGAFGLEVADSLLILAVFALCVFEFLTGIFLLLGSFRRSAPVMGMTLMLFMLPLTLWLAVKNPVSDCGCFGDAVILTNWQTFWKNVILTILLVLQLRFNDKARCLVRPVLQWVVLLISTLYITLIGLYGYLIQPMIDFRQYPVNSLLADYGEDKADAMDEAASFKFIYEKDGVRKEFSVYDSLPSEESGWRFVAREEIPQDNQQATQDTETTFRLWSEDGSEDMTEDVLAGEGYLLMLVSPDLAGISPATTWKINALRKEARQQEVPFIAAVAATPEQIETWRDLALPDYDIYTAEDTELKMLARGNPAVVMLQEGYVLWKSSLLSIPDDLQGTKLFERPHDDRHNLIYLSIIYILLTGAVALTSYLPALSVTRRDKEDEENKDVNAQ